MRPEKASIVSDLAEKLKRSPFVLVTNYQHMKVGDFSELRNRLGPAGAELHVVKNNFLKRAMSESGFADVSDKLIGQTAVVTGEKDVAPVAKVLKKFSTEFKIGALKIGLVDRAILSSSELETLADLPTRDVLLAQLLGLFLAPATRLVRVLNEPASAFARLLSAKAKTMPAAPEKPAPAEPKEPVAAEAEKPAVAEPEKPVAAEAEKPVVAEAEKPVAAEAEKPVVAEAEKPVAAEAPEAAPVAPVESSGEEKPTPEGGA